MSDSARLYAYKALFEAKRLVTRADMMEVAEVSLATFKRDIAKLRDQMGMPILFDKDRGGYFLDRNNLATEMPGLWFNPEELVALLTIQRLIGGHLGFPGSIDKNLGRLPSRQANSDILTIGDCVDSDAAITCGA